MRATILLVVCLLLQHGPAYSEDSPVVDAQASCVIVQNQDWGGSGVVVARSGKTAYVLTCQHVVPTVRGSLWVASIKDKDKHYPARLMWSEKTEGWDLAILACEAPMPAVVFAEKDVEKGDKIKQYGKTSGFSVGKVTGEVKWKDDTVSMFMDMKVIEGDSGAGVFRQDGAFVSILYAYVNNDHNKSMASRREDMNRFLEKHLKFSAK